MILPKKIKNIAHALLLPQKQDLVRASFNESELAVRQNEAGSPLRGC